MEKSFIFGIDKFPNWFIEECKNGKAKVNYDIDTGVPKSVRINNPTKTFVCVKGDKIIKMRTGLSCVKKNIETKNKLENKSEKVVKNE